VLELMKRMGREGEELVTCRETMERQVDHLVRLVDDLLDISRITRNKLELRLRRVDLASVLRDAIETSGQFHRVDLRLPDVPVWLQADPVRLAQVFGNLLNNAAKFSEPSSRIDVAVLREADGVTVRVRDEGIGIPADQLDSVFDMFSQVDRRLERTQGGLGIGLALVKRLIDLHEGTVSAASDGEGRGSEFVVRLPVAVGAPERAAPRTATPLPNGACRVLVVDDNRDSASSLAMLLTMTGHETHVAYDGVEAVDLAGQVLPGVILLDIGLPKLNGYDACRRIREQAWGKDIVMVAFSGWGQDEDLRRSKEAGFDAHLVKPVDYAALTRVIASHAPKGTA
jgi:CheY-like chemotaxis protein